MAAGDMIYGLFRADALRRVGGYRPVLVPDRLLLTELALLGTFVQAPEILWRRRFRGLANLERQRQVFWPAGAPAYARAPWWLQHVGALAREGDLRFALAYLDMSLRHRVWRRGRRLRHRAVKARNAALAPPVRVLMRRPAVRERVVPVVADVERTLTRLAEEERP
jgi:hypothetical protein